MAGAERFELPTIGFGDRCSTNWNYAPAKWMPIILTQSINTSLKDTHIGKSRHCIKKSILTLIKKQFMIVQIIGTHN